MNLKKFFLTKNACYITGRKLKLEGLMLHSTGANNPNISRYVPIEVETSNHWNKYTPNGREVCVHGFIGKLQDSTIASVQTLPWDMEGWHAGKTYGNQHYIGVEICEDGLEDVEYFNKVYNEAVELFAYLCNEFNLNPLRQIICHCEGYKKGIASNHSDVMHWFPKHGKSMDTFRADVKAKMNGQTTAEVQPKPTQKVPKKIDVKYQIYANGKWLEDIVNYGDGADGYAGIYGTAINGIRANTVGKEEDVGKLIYRVHTLNGKWLDEVTDREKDKNGDNYAGILERTIDGVMIKSTKGTARYRVHIINGSWLPWVEGYNINDSIKGYAGNLGHAIDGIQIEIV